MEKVHTCGIESRNRRHLILFRCSSYYANLYSEDLEPIKVTSIGTEPTFMNAS
jgi:hypothetical protein